ncbi:MAG: ComEC/Rec2 family competence protein [Planctomycetota bacterium]|nr:ComEC/Rec2 family competence protein [Planctomycetota bacterium]
MNWPAQASAPLVSVFVCAISGVVCDHYWPLPSAVYWVVLVICCFVLMAWKNLRAVKMGRGAFVITIFALLHHFDWWIVEPDDFAARIPVEGVVLTVTGQLDSMVDWIPAKSTDILSVGESKQRIEFLFQVHQVQQIEGTRKKWLSATGSGLVSCVMDSEEDLRGLRMRLRRGMPVRILVRCHGYSGNLNPGGWNADAFYWDRRISFRGQCQGLEAVQIVGEPNSGFLLATMDDVRRNMLHHLEQHLSPRSFAVAAALLLGNRHYLDKERNQVFMCTGTMHLFAISGLHVGILALVITFPIRFYPRYQFVLGCLAIIMIWGYATVTGCRPPVIRASILVTIVSICSMFHRPVAPLNSLALAGLCILVFNPTTMFQIGTQLSFLATAALFCCRKIILSSRNSDPGLLFILRRQPLAVRGCVGIVRSLTAGVVYTTVMWLICIPLVASGFHVISFVGVFLNVVLSIPIAVAFVFTFFLALFSEIPVLGTGLSIASESAIGILDWLVESTYQGGIGFWWAAGPTTAWLALFYFLVAVGMIMIETAGMWRRVAVVLSMFVIISISLWPTRAGLNGTVQERHQLNLHFIAVGHGTSVLIEQPNGENWLYDAGSLTRSEFAGRLIADVLWQRGHSSLDGIYISHADLDHFNAVSYLADRFRFSVCRTTPRMHRQMAHARDGTALAELQQQLDRHGIAVEKITTEQTWSIGTGGWLSVVSPFPGEEHRSDNEASLVLEMNIFQHRVLLPGDIEVQAISRLMGRLRGGFDMMMLPHHGSQHSVPDEMAGWSQPQFVVASTGHRYLPSSVAAAYQKAVRRRDGRVYITSQHGMISVQVGAEGIIAIPLADP